MPNASIVILIVVLLFSVVVHEVAHGWAADKLGDPTARKLGRLTLNPIVHIDLMWTIVIPIIMYLSMGFIFGGAKPVPINPYNFKNPKQGMAISAAAGPISNLLMATLGVVAFKVSSPFGLVPEFGVEFFNNFIAHFVFINCILMLFNLLPIPPLDGSKVLMGFMSYQTAAKYENMSQYGFFIIIGMILLGDLTGISLMSYLLMPFLYLINLIDTELFRNIIIYVFKG